jgi:hypothetical protein
MQQSVLPHAAAAAQRHAVGAVREERAKQQQRRCRAATAPRALFFLSAPLLT